MPLYGEDCVAALALGQSDLKYLFDREGLDLGTQAEFYHKGVTSARIFSAMASDAADFRATLKKGSFRLTRDRMKVARLLLAWEAAKTKTTNAAEGEADLRHESKPLVISDWRAMQRSFEHRWWKMDDDRLPHRLYLEKIEKTDYEAEPVSDVFTVEEKEGDVMRATLDTGGAIRAIKTAPPFRFPRTPRS